MSGKWGAHGRTPLQIRALRDKEEASASDPTSLQWRATVHPEAEQSLVLPPGMTDAISFHRNPQLIPSRSPESRLARKPLSEGFRA